MFCQTGKRQGHSHRSIVTSITRGASLQLLLPLPLPFLAFTLYGDAQSLATWRFDPIERADSPHCAVCIQITDQGSALANLGFMVYQCLSSSGSNGAKGSEHVIDILICRVRGQASNKHRVLIVLPLPTSMQKALLGHTVVKVLET